MAIGLGKSERIAYGKMEALVVFERADIVEAALVGHVQSNTPIHAYDEEVKVVAQSHAGAECSLPRQVLEVELASLAVGGVHLPNVAGIEEQCTIEIAEKARPVFKVG